MSPSSGFLFMKLPCLASILVMRLSGCASEPSCIIWLWQSLIIKGFSQGSWYPNWEKLFLWRIIHARTLSCWIIFGMAQSQNWLSFEAPPVLTLATIRRAYMWSKSKLQEILFLKMSNGFQDIRHSCSPPRMKRPRKVKFPISLRKKNGTMKAKRRVTYWNGSRGKHISVG